MHPVIENLLKRKNQSVPINDDRKIALVLFGGFMTGIRGAGAMMTLCELGLANAFDYIFTASAGFPNASYLLSGNPKLGTSIYYTELCSSHFINFYRFWNVADMDYLVQVTRNEKPLNLESIWKSKTKLFVRLKNTKVKQAEYIEVHDYPQDQYFNILKASISVPYLQPGAVKIGSQFYKDGEYTLKDSIQHLNHALESDATDILVIHNSSKLQQNKIVSDDRVFEIFPEPKQILSRIETNPECLKSECIQMGTVVKKAFGQTSSISLTPFELEPVHTVRSG